MTNERSDRDELAWIARATSSLPVPLSPWIRIVDRLGAAWMIEVEHLPHPRAAADDVGELVVPLLDVLAQVAVLVQQPAPLHRVADDDQHFVVLERLGDVVEGAGLHRRDRALDRCVGGDDDDVEVLVDPLQLVERRDAVEARHHDVDDGGIERQRARHLEPLGAGRGDADVVALARQQRLENLAHDLLVVDDEDGAVS